MAKSNVGPGAYVPRLARAGLPKRSWEASGSLRQAMWNGVMIYLILVLISLVARWIGHGFQFIPWIIAGGLTLWAFISGIAYFFGGAVPTWLVGFVRAQPGNTPGFSVDDGVKGGDALVRPLWKFFLTLILSLAVVFLVIALWPVQENLLGVIPALVASIMLVFTSSLLFASKVHAAKEKDQGNAPAVLFWIIHWLMLAVVLWFLGSVTPGVQDAQRKLLFLFETKVASNPADKARESFLKKRHTALVQKSKECQETLPDNPSVTALARCEAMRKAIDEPVQTDKLRTAREAALQRRIAAQSQAAAECWKGLPDSASDAAMDECRALEPQGPKSTVKATPHKGVVTTEETSETVSTTDPANCQTQYEGPYVPGVVGRPGLITDALFCPGKYEVVCGGARSQLFWNGGNSPKTWISTDCDGSKLTTVRTMGQMTGKEPPTMLQPIWRELAEYKENPPPFGTGTPFGAIVLWTVSPEGTESPPLMFGTTSRFGEHLVLREGARIQIGLNTPLGYYDGPSGIQIKIKRVQKSDPATAFTENPRMKA